MRSILSIIIIITTLLFSTPATLTIAQDYIVPYTSDQVTMQVELTMKLHEIKEFNVSITAENSSMTVIIDVSSGSGPLWGFFLEKASVYYPLNQSLAGLAACCTKYADHAVYYDVIHILSDPSPNYVLAFYDTHGHQANDVHFKATFLKGFLGNETTVTTGPSPAQSVFIYLVLPFTTIFILGTFVIIIRRARKSSKERNSKLMDQTDTLLKSDNEKL